jgi:acetylornithine deacetylase
MISDTTLAQDEFSTRRWLNRLVSIDTTSRDSNLGLIELVRDYLHSVGLQPRLTFNSHNTKANLFCTVPDMKGTNKDGESVGIERLGRITQT